MPSSSHHSLPRELDFHNHEAEDLKYDLDAVENGLQRYGDVAGGSVEEYVITVMKSNRSRSTRSFTCFFGFGSLPMLIVLISLREINLRSNVLTGSRSSRRLDHSRWRFYFG